MIIWKPRKSWGRLLSLQDLEPRPTRAEEGEDDHAKGLQEQSDSVFCREPRAVVIGGCRRYVARSGAGDGDGGEEDHAGGGGACYWCCVRYWYRGLVVVVDGKKNNIMTG